MTEIHLSPEDKFEIVRLSVQKKVGSQGSIQISVDSVNFSKSEDTLKGKNLNVIIVLI